MSTQTKPAAVDTQGLRTSFLPLLLSFLAWCFLVVVAILAVIELKAPAPVAATAPAIEFSSERALVHVRALATAPHPLGSSGNAQVRDYLFGQLATLGLNPQIFSAIGTYSRGGRVAIANVHDILGRMPGSASSGAIMLMAHYDSVYRAPGAADDGAGVAAILESVRALRAGPALKNDLIVLFTDGEEPGLLGAEAFATSHPWMKDVGLILNFEARGDKGPSMLFETSPNNALLIKAVAQSSSSTIGSSLFYSFYKLLPNDTDFTIFRSREIPGLNFAFGENLQAYHSRLDTAENLSPDSLQHHGSYALTLAQKFGQIDLTQLKTSTGDDVFFNWLGSRLITYGEGWVLPGEILVAGLLICTIVLSVRRSQITLTRVLLALLPNIVFLLAIPVVMAAAAWLVFRILGRRMMLGDSTANLCLLCGLVLLGAWAGSLLFARFRKRFTIEELSFAGLVLAWVLSLAVALILPAGSYLLFWPLLLMTLGLLVIALANRKARSGIQGLAALAGTAITILIFAPLIYLLYVFLTLQLITVAAAGLLLGLFFIVCAPWLNIALPRSGWLPVTLVLLLGAVVSLGVGAKLSHYSAQHPQNDTILYSLNADDHRAAWISYDRSLDTWTAQFFANRTPQQQPMPNYLGNWQNPVLSGPAPLVETPSPIAEVKKDTTEGNIRRIQLNVRSPRNARSLLIAFDKGVEAVSIKAGGREITPGQNSGFSRISLIGPDAQGTDLELALRGTSPISFWLMDQSSGLPGEIRPRPDSMMAGDGSDITLVCRKYSF